MKRVSLVTTFNHPSAVKVLAECHLTAAPRKSTSSLVRQETRIFEAWGRKVHHLRDMFKACQEHRVDFVSWIWYIYLLCS